MLPHGTRTALAPAPPAGRRASRSFLPAALLAGVLGVGLTAGVADGQPAPSAPGSAEAPNADQRYAEAQQHYVAKRYTEALPIFRELAASSESPNAWLYVARCLRELGQLPEAYDTMVLTERLAAERAAREPRFVESHEAAKRELGDLEARLGRVSLYLPTRPQGLEIEMNGLGVAAERWATPIAVLPGTVRIWAKAPGYASIRQEVEIPPGKVVSVTIALSPLGPTGPVPAPPSASAPSAAPAPASAPWLSPGTLGASPVPSAGGSLGNTPRPPPPAPLGDEGSSGLTVAGAIALVIGGLGAVTFITAGTMANDRFDEIEKTCHGTRCTDPELNPDIDEGRTMDQVANVGLGVGIVGVVLGTLLLVVDAATSAAPEPAPPTPAAGARNALRLDLGPTGACLRW